MDTPWALPGGWQWTPLGDLVEFLDRMRVPVNDAERTRRIAGKQRHDLFPYYGANGQVGWIDEFIFNEKLVLLAEDGGYFDDPLKPVAYIAAGKYWVNNHAHVLRPTGGVLHEYLVHALNTLDLLPFVSGTTRLKLNQGAARRILVPIAPLQEQRSIVARVEELLIRRRDAAAAVGRIPGLLVQFREKVLAEAFQGRLTEGDRGGELLAVTEEPSESGRSTELSQSPSDSRSPWKLPEGWAWVTLGEVVSSMKNGLYKPKDFYGNGVPCLRMYNIEDGEIILRDLKLMELTRDELEAYGLLPGDLLVNRVNSRELVGKTAVVPDGLGPLVFESKNIRLRIGKGVDPRYVARYLQTPFVRGLIDLKARQTVGMATINQEDMAGWPLPLAPPEEQGRIVSAIEALFSQASAMGVACAKAQLRLDRIEQAVLAKALQGDLAERDPGNDRVVMG